MQKIKSAMEVELRRVADSGLTPTLLLHSCCAPCSSYVLEYLSAIFRVTILFYNPNIYPSEEYAKRAEEQKRLLTLTSYANPVEIILGRYNTADYEQLARPYAAVPEGGKRCEECIRMRLRETAAYTACGGYDYFTSTLTVSPHKNAVMINAIGAELGEEGSARYLIADFKKNDGYKRSVEISRQLGLYRQSYCGCEYSAP